MIFLCTGTQKFPFDRLLKETDRLVNEGVIRDTVIAQTGTSAYQPSHLQAQPFFSHDEMQKYTEEADLIITHGGSGSIMNALKLGRKVIAVPRLARFGEHVDDHQTQLVRALADAGYLCACMNIEELGRLISDIPQMTLDRKSVV